MIVRRLQSENILKFSRLDLSFPEKGRILISGNNESGKSAIIETLCLGLFGRSANLPATGITKAIRWGETSGWISLDFADKDGRYLTVYRYFSRQDPAQATLRLKDANAFLAQGETEVNEILAEVIGMDFSHFIDTLYLTQEAPEGKNPELVVRTIAGITQLEELAVALRHEDHQNRQSLQQAKTDLAAAEKALSQLNLEVNRLGELRHRHEVDAAQHEKLQAGAEACRNQMSFLRSGKETAMQSVRAVLDQGQKFSFLSWQRQLESLEVTLLSLTQSLPEGETGNLLKKMWEKSVRHGKALSGLGEILSEIKEDRKRRQDWVSGDGDTSLDHERKTIETAQTACIRSRKGGSRLFLFFFPIALILGAASFSLNFFPGDPRVVPVADFITSRIPGYDPAFLLPAMGVSVVFLLLALMGLGKTIGQGSQGTHYRGQLQKLEEKGDAERALVDLMERAMDLPLVQQLEMLQTVAGEIPWVSKIVQWAASQGKSMASRTSLAFLLDGWKKDVSQFDGMMDDLVRKVDGELTELLNRSATLQGQLTKLSQEIVAEAARFENHEKLRGGVQELKQRLIDLSQEIEVCGVALRLVQGTCQEVSFGFSHELRRLIGKTAPLFTQGRYQHLRIDENLALSAFSPVKNDFVDLSESSRGVRRQLMLALRMALAQALTTRSNSQSQFLILDEPFAHYDHIRFKESFTALADMGGVIEQIFVVNQSFEEDLIAEAPLHIHCSLETTILETVAP